MLERIQASNGEWTENREWYLLILNTISKMNEHETWTITQHKELFVPD